MINQDKIHQLSVMSFELYNKINTLAKTIEWMNKWVFLGHSMDKIINLFEFDINNIL